MHSSTKQFIALQRLYHDRAERDIDALTAHLETLLRTTGSPLTIPREEVTRFAKNAGHLRVVRSQSYAQSRNDARGDVLSERLNDDDQPEGKNVLWWLLIEAVGAFQAKHNRFPGQSDADVATDAALLRADFTSALTTYGVKPSDEVAAQIDEHVAEAVRYGGCEMHNIAAFMGGVVSLEMIKLATHQWVRRCLVFHVSCFMFVCFVLLTCEMVVPAGAAVQHVCVQWHQRVVRVCGAVNGLRE